MEGHYDRLMLIRRLKPLGYSFKQMGDLLRAIEGASIAGQIGEDATEALSYFPSDAEERRAKLANQLAAADEFIGVLDGRINR